MRILYDGWSLVYEPLGPASLHLLSILENIPGEINPVLALPEDTPGWLDFSETVIIPAPNTPWGRLRWEQFALPSLVKELRADLLHLVTPSAPSLRNPNTLFSPTGFGAGRHSWSGIQPTFEVSKHVFDRLRISMGLGGLVHVSKILWPSDLPAPALAGPLERIQPILPLKFAQGQDLFARRKRQLRDKGAPLVEQLQLPDEFILYHGPGGRRHLELLAQAWHWAAAPIGENYPLLLIGLHDEDRQIVSELVNQLDFGGSFLALPDVTPDMLPELYQLSTAVFHPVPASPWCGPVRLALASGKPLAATGESLTAAIAGPAAYLVSENDARALGAALVTIIVEQEMADNLSAAAKHRAQEWITNNIGDQLLRLYSSASRIR
jgi:hypothetical protein